MKSDQDQSIAEKLRSTKGRKTLRKFRKEAGLSLIELAAMTKLSQSSLSRFESGKRGLSPAALARLENAILDVLSEKRAATKLAALRESDTAKKLIPAGTMPLKSLAGENFDSLVELFVPDLKAKINEDLLGITLQRVAELEKLIKIQEELLKSYRDGLEELFGENSDLQKSLNEKEARLKELKELLGLETEAALTRNKADEFRDKIKKSVTAPEGGE